MHDLAFIAPNTIRASTQRCDSASRASESSTNRGKPHHQRAEKSTRRQRFFGECLHAFQRHIALYVLFVILNFTPGLSNLSIFRRNK
ncbi:hypothetical protein ASE07_07085 [Noviherbaspirillum sp. Root189]|nr:hypothetical protein ASE07_07085 [Noviherbaspirillum sp. Root189]